MAIEPLARQPPDELPQRHVRVHVRQQPPQPLQPTVTLGVDDDLHLVAPGAQRPHLVGRDRQLGVHAGQQLLYLPRALAGRLRHQRLPRGPVQHRRRFQRLDSRRWRQQRLLPRHGRPAPHDGAAPSALPVALLTVECALQLSCRAQGERSVLQPFAHLLELGAEVHGVDAPRGGGVGIAELAHHVVEQAGEAAAEIQPARVDLAQMVDDGDLELLFEVRQFPGLRKQRVVAEAGDGGGEFDFVPGAAVHAVNITTVWKWDDSTSPGWSGNRRSVDTERAAELPTGPRSFSEPRTRRKRR